MANGSARRSGLPNMHDDFSSIHFNPLEKAG